ncbi:unnamed protein product, partial [Effrenium voratum]
DWVARLRYVVFDEVHCIGEQEGGVQWEHCMQLIPCPFIALSATVADPSVFHNWLGRVNEKKELAKVSIIEHRERWNDLYKYVWHKGELRPLHPFCCLVESSVRRNGMSSDLTLVPREMVQLYQEVKKIIGPNKLWDRLSPKEFFAGMSFVTKIDSRNYEKQLKESFLELLKSNTLQTEGFSQLTLSLQQFPDLDLSFSPPPRVEAEASDLRNLTKKKQYQQAQKMKASSKQEAKAARNDEDNEGRGAAKAEAVDITQDMMMAEPKEPKDIQDEIDPEFSFHSAKALGVWQEDIEDQIEDARKKGRAEAWMIEGLRRGIGMHHEGLKKPYKDAVEILFRRGYLRVVFATGTLALGINMPCRSTIFCGDSLELTGLMYRQMSGRAGRRGFDLLGQVIFLDKPFVKIQRLITSDLSSLAGEFTLSPTILLRALNEWETVQALEEDSALGRPSKDIARCLAPVFALPFFQSKTAELDTQVAYHTRFTMEFLYKEGLIERDGTTRNLANLCTHLFEAEPANLIFCRLLSTGLLHDYLAQEAKKVQKGDRRTHLTVKLAALLGWIFFRRRLPPSVPKERLHRKKHLPSEGCPKLPPLTPRIRKEIQRYNLQLFEIFQQFAYAVAVTRKIGETDVTLPNSQRSFRHKLDERGQPFDANASFGPELLDQLVKYKARSPFSALAGVGDQFRSPIDLCKNCRNVLHLDLNAIPTVACPPQGVGDESADLEETNSWILDFMIHGQRKYLWEDNGINATRAWKMTDEFVQTLKKAEKALKAFAADGDIVLTTTAALAKEMEAYHKKG